MPMQENRLRAHQQRGLCSSLPVSKHFWASSCYDGFQVWALFWKCLRLIASENTGIWRQNTTHAPLKMESLGPARSQALFCKQDSTFNLLPKTWRSTCYIFKDLDSTYRSTHLCSIRLDAMEPDLYVWWFALCVHFLLGTKLHSMQISFLFFKDSF